MKILIGHDGTDQGRDALALGREIADVLGAAPLVLTVLTWPSNIAGPDDLEVAAKADTDEIFAVARDFLDGLSPETTSEIKRSPAEAIYEVAEDRGASLIVVGSSHRGPIGRVLPGSVGTALLHGAPCAVLVAPRGFAEAGSRTIARLGAAFDGSAESSAALDTAIGIAERVHGSLDVFTVAEHPRYGPSTAFSVLTAQEYNSFERDQKRRLLEQASGRVPAPIRGEAQLLEGEAGPALAEAAEGLDLLVVGSRGYGPLRRVLLGSASARLVRSAPCPVLVLPRGAGADPLALRERGASGAQREG